jgi:NTE family protein
LFHDTLDRIRGLMQPERRPAQFGLVLTGGGARAAYQAGVIQYISDHFDEARFSVLVGVSAGAINAAHLANIRGTFPAAAGQLVEHWREIRSHDVYEMESTMALARAVLVRSMRGSNVREEDIRGVRAFARTAPLREYLERKLETEDGKLVGLTRNLTDDVLRAVAIVTTSYTTGQTVTWIQGSKIVGWERPNRIGINTTLTVDHIMASTSLPFFFPAVNIGEAWYGDGGIRLATPLAPAIHLGADHILAISTRYNRSKAEADQPAVVGYPPASQIFGILTNAVFLDALDQDAIILQRVNQLLERVPARKRLGLRPISLLMLRPSIDLGKLASEYEATLPSALGVFARTLGTEETRSPDWLSMLLFEHDYLTRLLETGYEDARTQHNRIETFFDVENRPHSIFGGGM